MDYKNILFDLDGTLTDPALGITSCVAYALGKYGIEVSDLSTLNCFIGPPLLWSFSHYYGMSDEEASQCVKYYRERFSTIGMFENHVYEGIPELLSALKSVGYRLIIATSKPEEFTNIILHHFDLMQYFAFVGGNTLSEQRPTKDAVIRYVMDSVPDVTAENSIMVGDREHDIFGAKANGLRSIGVLYGYGDENELDAAGADRIVKTVADLSHLLLESNECFETIHS